MIIEKHSREDRASKRIRIIHPRPHSGHRAKARRLRRTWPQRLSYSCGRISLAQLSKRRLKRPAGRRQLATRSRCRPDRPNLREEVIVDAVSLERFLDIVERASDCPIARFAECHQYPLEVVCVDDWPKAWRAFQRLLCVPSGIGLSLPLSPLKWRVPFCTRLTF